MVSGPRRIDRANYSAYLFSKDEELFKGTAAKINKAVKIEGVPSKTSVKRDTHWAQVHTPGKEAEALAKSILKSPLHTTPTARKEAIIEEVEKRDVQPGQKKEFRTAVNSRLFADLIDKTLEKTPSLEEIVELLKFIDSSKDQVDDKTFHKSRGEVMQALCEKMPTNDKTTRQTTAKALYASREHFHLGNIHTIKDPAIKKMCEDIDKEIRQTLEGCIEHEGTPDFIDEYLGAMAGAVKLVNSADAYIAQAPEEKKQVLRSTNKLLQGILSPGKKGWFGRVNSTFEESKIQVAFQGKKLDLMTQVKTSKAEFPNEKDSWKTLETELHGAKDLKRLDQIETGLNNFILELASDQGPTDSSSESDKS